jgi:hypothetical protein
VTPRSYLWHLNLKHRMRIHIAEKRCPMEGLGCVRNFCCWVSLELPSLSYDTLTPQNKLQSSSSLCHNLTWESQVGWGAFWAKNSHLQSGRWEKLCYLSSSLPIGAENVWWNVRVKGTPGTWWLLKQVGWVSQQKNRKQVGEVDADKEEWAN